MVDGESGVSGFVQPSVATQKLWQGRKPINGKFGGNNIIICLQVLQEAQSHIFKPYKHDLFWQVP